VELELDAPPSDFPLSDLLPDLPPSDLAPSVLAAGLSDEALDDEDFSESRAFLRDSEG